MKTLRQCLFLLLGLALTGCNLSLAADVTPPPGYTPPTQVDKPVSNGPFYPMVAPDPSSGGPIYAEKCAACHGDTGKGDGPRAAQLSNPVAAIGAAELAHASTPAGWFRIVTEGNLEKFMPPFPSLTDRQRWDVVAYAYRLSMPEESIAQGQKLYAANCAECHGEGGQGGSSQVDFTDQEYMAGKSAQDLFTVITDGAPPSMPSYAGQFSETERWAVTDYLRSLTFAGAGGAITQAGTPGVTLPAEGTAVPGSESTAGATEVAATAEVTNTLGTIDGWVENGSGGEIPTGLDVTLYGFNQMQVAITQTTTVQSDGKYQFVDVEMPPGRVYLTITKYGGTEYGSDIVTVEPGTTSLELPIRIYETTTDASGLITDRLHLFFEFLDQKTVRVIELFVFSNSGEKTIVPPAAGQPAVTFNLPEAAANLEFDDGALGERFIKTPGGFGDTLPIRPGSNGYQVLFSYEMSYDRSLELVQTMTVPVNAVVILAPAGDIQVKGEGVQATGTQDVDGVQYQLYSSQALQTGETLQLTVTGKPASSPNALSPSSNNNLIIGVAALGITLLLSGLWMYQRNRRVSEAESLEESVEPDEPESSEAIMDAILALDDQYQAGNLSETAYRQRRAELKARLEDLLAK